MDRIVSDNSPGRTRKHGHPQSVSLGTLNRKNLSGRKSRIRKSGQNQRCIERGLAQR